MNKRELTALDGFAAKAMEGFLSSQSNRDLTFTVSEEDMEHIARMSYSMAYKMLRERRKWWEEVE